MDVINNPRKHYLKHINNYIVREDGCWEYDGKLESKNKSTDKRGRVAFKVDGKCRKYYVNRLVYAHHNKTDLYGLNVINTCGNKNCINPDHLVTANQSETMINAQSNNMLSSQKGAKNPNAKLSEHGVLKACEMMRLGFNNKEIASELLVSHSMISRIRLGHSWAHITGIKRPAASAQAKPTHAKPVFGGRQHDGLLQRK